MEFRILGPVEVGDGRRAVVPTRGKERHVLAVLAANANQVVPADRVAEVLWPGPGTPEHSVRAVQTHVSRLRSTLGPAGERLLTRPSGYLLRVEPEELDSQRFEALIGEARRRAAEDPAAALGLVDRALALWRGPPYGELRDEEFALGDAVRLEELRLVAIEERIDARLFLGHHEEVVGEIEALRAEHPLRERPRGQLMLALYRSGRQPEALRAFEAFRRVLADELGLDPSPELRALEARILDHDPGLAPRRTAGPAPASVATAMSSFVGREAEVADVTRRLAAARLLTLTGPGGVGKTRLALQVATAGRAVPGRRGGLRARRRGRWRRGGPGHRHRPRHPAASGPVRGGQRGRGAAHQKDAAGRRQLRARRRCCGIAALGSARQLPDSHAAGDE